MVLLSGGGQIDGFAVDEGQLAMNDGWADGAGDGDEHGEKRSLHENDMRGETLKEEARRNRL